MRCGEAVLIEKIQRDTEGDTLTVNLVHDRSDIEGYRGFWVGGQNGRLGKNDSMIHS